MAIAKCAKQKLKKQGHKKRIESSMERRNQYGDRYL